MSKKIQLGPDVGGFAEDKDRAKAIRIEQILPALEQKKRVVLDFDGVSCATQAYVHALIGEALKKHGEAVLELIEFRNCSPQLRSLIELVVDYSLVV